MFNKRIVILYVILAAMSVTRPALCEETLFRRFASKVEEYAPINKRANLHTKNLISLQKGVSSPDAEVINLVFSSCIPVSLVLQAQLDLHALEAQMVNVADRKETQKVINKNIQTIDGLCTKGIDNMTQQIVATRIDAVSREIEKVRDAYSESCTFMKNW